METFAPLKDRLESILETRYPGRFRIEQVLGQGGAATVFKALDQELDRPVAIKVVQSTADLNTRSAQRFEYEAKTMARIQHENLVQVFEYGTTEREAFLIVEYVDGISLGQFVSGGRSLTVNECVTILNGILSGLEAAHAAEVVHRDLKPDNILIDGKGRIKIMDFGLARGPDREFETQPGVVLGTLPYMSPEQLQSSEVGPASDYYAVGVVLYRILTGRLPHDGRTEAALVRARLSQPAPPLREHMRNPPPWMETLVAGLLERDPDARWSDPAEIRHHLETSQSTVRSAATLAIDPSTIRDIGARGRARDHPSRVGSGRMDRSRNRTSRRAVSSAVPVPAASSKRAGVLGLGLVALLGVGAFFMAPGSRTLRELVVTVRPTRLEVRATWDRPGPVVVAISREADMEITANREIEDGVSIHEFSRPITEAFEATRIRLDVGREDPLEIQVPGLPRAATPIHMARFSLPADDVSGMSWEARVRGADERHEVKIPGEFLTGRIRFHDELVRRWPRSTLIEVTGVGDLDLGPSAPKVPTVVRLEVGRSLTTIRGLQDLARDVSGLRSTGAIERRLPEIAKVLDEALQVGDGVIPVTMVHDAIAASPPGSSWSDAERNAIHDWVSRLGLFATSLREWDRAPPFDPLELLAPRFVVSRRLFDPRRDAIVPPLKGILPIGEQQKTLTAGSLQAIGQAHMVKEYWPQMSSPDREDRPRELQGLSNPFEWAGVHRIPVRREITGPLPERIMLQIAVWYCVRRQYLELEFPESSGLPLLRVTNPDDLGTPEDPHHQDLPYPEGEESWLNWPVRATTLSFSMAVPRSLIDLPEELKLSWHLMPAPRKTNTKWMVVLGARWLPDRSPR